MVASLVHGLVNPYDGGDAGLPERVRPRSSTARRVLALGAASVGLGLAGGAVASAAPEDGGVTVLPAGSPTPLGAEVLNGPDVDVPSAQRLLAALLLEGVITQEQFAQFSGDPAFVSGVGSILGSGGTVRWDSPGQAEMDRLLAASSDQMRAVMAQPFDPLQGPSGAQLLTIHALSGGNDFAFLEILLHTLQVKHPDLELRADYRSGSADDINDRELVRFGFVRGGAPVSSPFLDTLVGRFDPVDLKLPTNDRNPQMTFRVLPTFESVNGTRWATSVLCAGSGGRGCHVQDIVGADPAAGTHVGGVPPRGTITFDVDDNYVTGSKTAGSDTEAVRFLGLRAPELLTGREYLSIADRTTLLGGLGDDFFGVVGGDVTVAGGGGDNTTVVAGTGDVTVVDAPGGTEAVTTVAADGGSVRAPDPAGGTRVVDVPPSTEIAGVAPTGGADLTLTSPPAPCGVDGSTVVRLGTDGQIDADLASCDATAIGVLPGADVEVGRIDAPGPGQQTVAVAGTLTGAEGAGSIALGADDDQLLTRAGSHVSGVATTLDEGQDEVQLGGSVQDSSLDTGDDDDRLTTLPGSEMINVPSELGDGDDLARLAGHSEGSPVELDEGNDTLVLFDSATGEYFFADDEASWCYAKDCPGEGEQRDGVREEDTVQLGPGFAPVDPDDLGRGVQRVDPATGQPVAFVDGALPDIEIVAIAREDGLETLRFVPPEVVRQASFLKVLSDIAGIAGLLTLNPALAAVGEGLGAGYALANGADPGTTLIDAGTGIAGRLSGVPWVAPAGDLTTAAITGNEEGLVVAGLATAGGVHADVAGIPAGASPFTQAAVTARTAFTAEQALAVLADPAATEPMRTAALLSLGGAVNTGVDLALGPVGQHGSTTVGTVLDTAAAATSGDVAGVVEGGIRLTGTAGALAPDRVDGAELDLDLDVPALPSGVELETPTSPFRPVVLPDAS